MFAPSWDKLEPNWSQVGAKMRHVGAKLGQVGAKADQLGTKLAQLGQSLAKTNNLKLKKYTTCSKMTKDGPKTLPKIIEKPYKTYMFCMLFSRFREI